MSIYHEKEGGYTIMIPDLDGCMTQGETLQEAINNIDEARELWIETVYSSGKKEIPFPFAGIVKTQILAMIFLNSFLF